MGAVDKRKRRLKLWTLYAGRCFWCGKKIRGGPEPGPEVAPLKANMLTLDELIPRSRGGSQGLYNTVPAHRICNERRGNMIAPQDAIARHLAVITLGQQ